MQNVTRSPTRARQRRVEDTHVRDQLELRAELVHTSVESDGGFTAQLVPQRVRRHLQVVFAALWRHAHEHHLGDLVVGQSVRMQDEQRQQLPRAAALARARTREPTVAVQHERAEHLRLQARQLVVDHQLDVRRLWNPGPRTTRAGQSLDFTQDGRMHTGGSAVAQQPRVFGGRSHEQVGQASALGQGDRRLELAAGRLRATEMQIRGPQPVQRLGLLVGAPGVASLAQRFLEMVDGLLARALDEMQATQGATDGRDVRIGAQALRLGLGSAQEIARQGQRVLQEGELGSPNQSEHHAARARGLL